MAKTCVYCDKPIVRGGKKGPRGGNYHAKCYAKMFTSNPNGKRKEW